MKAVIAIAILMIGLTSYGQLKPENGRHVVLPNPKLIGCRSSSCSQLREDNPAKTDAIYPRQMTVDFFDTDHCPLGVTALYEKSVSMDDLKAAIDERYGKWALASNDTAPAKLWRVEPEKFAIQLAVTEAQKMTRDEVRGEALAEAFDPRERSNVAEGGMKQVIYLAFAGTECGGQ